jgi:hypothetical protein
VPRQGWYAHFQNLYVHREILRGKIEKQTEKSTPMTKSNDEKSEVSPVAVDFGETFVTVAGRADRPAGLGGSTPAPAMTLGSARREAGWPPRHLFSRRFSLRKGGAGGAAAPSLRASGARFRWASPTAIA